VSGDLSPVPALRSARGRPTKINGSQEPITNKQAAEEGGVSAASIKRAKFVKKNASPITISTLSPEHIVATALRIGRPKDRERIVRFIEAKAVDLKVLRDVLDRNNLRKEWSSFCRRMELPDFDE
jgi:hypothetical protein